MAQPAPSSTARERLLLDFGWRFHLGNADDPEKDFGLGAKTETFAKSGGFVKPGDLKFDDNGWKPINIPHDWAIDLPFVDDPVVKVHGFKPLGRMFPDTSIGWYRRVFNLPAEDAGKRISLEFDGVFRDAMVIFNNHHIGENFSGYAPFEFDVTDFANIGAPNTLVVRVNATLNEGWFYEGAGIYRHVSLVKTNPVHVPQFGCTVRSEMNADATGPASLNIIVEVTNESGDAVSVAVKASIFDADGTAAGTARSSTRRVEAWEDTTFAIQIPVDRPRLWSIDDPHLYRAVATVDVNGNQADEYETTFGIRTVRFDANDGFFLNNKPMKIQGMCNHQDHAGVGAAVPDQLNHWRVQHLKDMGVNGYRTSHNPPTPSVLDACDRLGMLVMDETRMMSSNPEGLSQLERLIRRDRNHPSVVIWSLGNEEREQGTLRGEHIVATMKRMAKDLDPTRPVTVAMNNAWGKGVSHVVDVQGFNYNDGRIDAFHNEFPKKPCVGTETASTVATRGIYTNDPKKGYLSAYDLNKPPWGNTAGEWWSLYESRQFLSGGFVWTGFDYRGEPTPYGWPCINSHFGIMDTCGFPKDDFYYYRSWWQAEPVLHLFPHWNWSGKEGQTIQVWCFSNLDHVELLLNGKSLGAKPMPKNGHVQWDVVFQPGAIEARGFKGNSSSPVLTAKRETTGAPAKIRLTASRPKLAADGEDVAVITTGILDSQDRIVPVALNLVTFSVSGRGRLIGVGNGDPSSHESDMGPSRSAFNGLCQAIVQSTRQAGQVQITASSPGLAPTTLNITCDPATPRPFVA
ncbi:MAG TPA: beta-galactosidase GalA [Bryobacteraceae bacterium]|nr:beta-galactosidase GalA [Bryobacteraceae bacterium]